MLGVTSCENDNINPYDYAEQKDTIYIGGDGVKTTLATYPAGAIVWTHDTTLAESFEVPEGSSLYIEPGVTVTCSSKASVPVEIVVLGNLYCMGTAEKPITITSDDKKPAAWGGIICGYNSEEVVLNHVDLAYAGATPTESSLSFQNKLFKTTIDGGVPAFHFCNVDGRFVMANCYFHDNYNDQTYFTGGKAVIVNNVFANSGNAADGGEAINVKAGCDMDIAYNVMYDAATNAFKLSGGASGEATEASNLRIFNNTMVDCGWRRSKNKKGGSVWLEKGIEPVMVNNLVYDCRYGIKQPKKDGAGKGYTLVPNYFFASTDKGVEQMSKDADLAMYFDENIYSASAGDKDPLFVSFEQNSKMDINCQVDEVESGAPLPFSTAWDFHLKAGSPALSGGTYSVALMFPQGIAFMGMKKVIFNTASDDQNYYFTAGTPAAYFGAYGTK